MRKVLFVLLWLVLSLVVAHFGLMYYVNSQITQNRIQAHVTQFNKAHADQVVLSLAAYEHSATQTDLIWHVRVRIPGDGWHEFAFTQKLKPGLFSLERLREGQLLPILMDIDTRLQSVDGQAQTLGVHSVLHFNKHLESTINAPTLTVGQWQLNQLLADLIIDANGNVTDGHIEVGHLQLGQLISLDQLRAQHLSDSDHHNHWQLKAADFAMMIPIESVMYVLHVQQPQYEIEPSVQNSVGSAAQSGDGATSTLIQSLAKTEVGGQFGVEGHLADFGPADLKINLTLNGYGMLSGIVVKGLNVNDTDHQLLLSLQGNALFDEGLLVRGAPVMWGLGEFELGANPPVLLKKANQVAQQTVGLDRIAKLMQYLTGKPVSVAQLHAYQLLKIQYNARSNPVQWWFNQYQLSEKTAQYLQRRVKPFLPKP